jgi:hypothetical protein
MVESRLCPVKPLLHRDSTCLSVIVDFCGAASPITHVVMGSVQCRDIGTASFTLASLRWAGNNPSLALARPVLAVVVGTQTITTSAYPRILRVVRG